MGMSFSAFLEQKGREYAGFDPNRAKRLYKQLSANLSLPPHAIQILGTNGKGSTGRFLAQALQSAGKSTLHFTSPHLLDISERFYKNGACVCHEALDAVQEFLQGFDFLQEASYFEYVTFAALFLAQDVEYLIMEAGIGGEFDATSCLDYELNIFTSISTDHQELLGESIAEIAATKLRAMGRRALLAKQNHKEVLSIAKEIATQKNAELFLAKSCDWDFLDSFSLANPSAADVMAVTHQTTSQNFATPPLAPFLRENLHTACCALRLLGFAPPNFPMQLDLRARFEKIAPNIILDVGHNEDASLQIAQILRGEKIHLIYNSYAQKNVRPILLNLRENIELLEILPIKHPRILQQSILEEILKELEIPYQIFAKILPQKNYLVFGSFSVVEAFLRGGYAK
ncbi:folylpolyglutamate synthase/dihydrofolate synthase [Helicobacter mustelae]|nr:folylpolyglutamate synthase/dihydrofolate synthase [Helicobacter mustelae]